MISLLCKCIFKEDTLNVEAQNMICFILCVCVGGGGSARHMSVCQAVCHGTVRESICTDGHIFRGL